MATFVIMSIPVHHAPAVLNHGVVHELLPISGNLGPEPVLFVLFQVAEFPAIFTHKRRRSAIDKDLRLTQTDVGTVIENED